MTEHLLKAPFPADKIKWRAGATNQEKTKAMALAYIDARDVMDRLDDVVGYQNWQSKYVESNGTMICSIGIRIDGDWVWKADGAGQTDFEGEKGSISGALKRAAVAWGIGRYLYDLDGIWVKYDPQRKRLLETPNLPGWALPEGSKTTEARLEQPKRPLAPAELKNAIDRKAAGHVNDVASETDRKVVASYVNSMFDGDKTKRYEFCKWIAGAASTKDIPNNYILALMDWMGVSGWDQAPSQDAIKEAQSALPEALKAAGQKELM